MLEIDYLQLSLKIITGLIVSYIFLSILLGVYKPKIKISEYICKIDDDIVVVDENGNNKTVKTTIFKFKVVNMSRYNAYDVKFNLNLRTPYMISGGKVNHRISPIELRRDFLPYIPKYNKNIGFAEHAILLGTLHDLDTNINQKNLDYELTIMAKHGFSNMTSVTYKRFSSKDKVKVGEEFEFGRKLGTTK